MTLDTSNLDHLTDVLGGGKKLTHFQGAQLRELRTKATARPALLKELGLPEGG